jgi:hypothetical protein
MVLVLSLLSPCWATAQVVQAVPHFVADVSADAVVAERAWRAARVCTGRDAPSAPDITITRSVIPGGWLGRAHVHEQGLERIDLSAPAQRIGEVIVHEVAHAWVAEGDQALVEGAAELLADCIVATDPGIAPLQFDDGRDLVALTDLRTWGIAEEGRPLAMDGVRTDAYLGASRLLRTATEVIAPQLLWQGERLTWEALEGWLADAGDEAVLAVVRGGPTMQRRALADADLDGLTDLAEALRGTDPRAFDSDGDGWWDGADARPDDAVVVPLDGTFACAGSTAPGAGEVTALPGGNLRGWHVPTVRTLHTAAGAVLVQLDRPNQGTSGGMWATAPGTDDAHSACVSAPGLAVAASDPAALSSVAPLAQALQAPVAAAEQRLGPASRRVVVLLGEELTSYDGHTATVTLDDLRRAEAAGRLDELAATLVALPRVWSSGDRSWREAEALGRSLSR